MRQSFFSSPRRVSTDAVIAAAASAALALAGCSPVTRYYTLSPVVDAAAGPLAPNGGGASGVPGAGASSASSAGAVIALGPVTLPDYIDRPQIVVRSGPNTLEQATFDQWGGSLDDMIPRLLVEDLAARLPADHVVAFPQASDVAFEYRVPVSISQFDVSSSGEAVVAARWQVRGSGGTLLVRESVARAQAAGKSYSDRVAALSRALADLTGDIAKALAPLARGETAASAEATTKKKR